MSRRHIFIAALAIAVTLPNMASAQTKVSPPGITIVIPITAIGASREASVKGMQAVVAVIRKQPGLIDEVLMESQNPASKPSHVHVMHWREQKNWEMVFVNPDFRKVMKDNAAVLTVADGASIYTPVK